MRALNGFCIALLFAGGLCAQYRGNATPYITGGFPSVVHPGGTPANSPGIVRYQTNVVNPGGGGPQLRVPFSPGYKRFARGTGSSIIYSYPFPIYVGGFGGGGYYDSPAAGYMDSSAAAMMQPPGPAGPAAPIIINVGVPTAPPAAAPMPPAPPEANAQPQEDASAAEPTHYLIAFKDHTIYSAIAYWVDGTTLHYFTSGNVHNQVSLSLIDRELTQRLNRESGLEVKLPQ
jgi:hypothetical protein